MCPNDNTQNIPYGYCKCGCGQKTKINPQSSVIHGYTIGEPRDYLHGHNGKYAPSVTIADIFWSHCNKGNPVDCWIWQGSINLNGYGTFTFRQKSYYAHRVSYELAFGPIPEGMEICHNCPTGDNPSCINPSHFFLGTQTENMSDMYKKGRQAHGEGAGNARLTEDNVRQIRQLREQGLLHREIAAMFDVRRDHIGAILRGKIWRHVT